MRLPAAGRYAIVAAMSVALLMLHASANAQSLFNTRGSSGQTQASVTSTAASPFGSIGFPRPASANNTQGAGGAFVGRSNRGFVGGRAASQSSASGGGDGNANRGAAGSRSGGEGVVERAAVPPSADRQLESSINSARRTRIIPRHRIAFEFPAKQAAAINGELTRQLANLAARYPDFAHIEVQVEPDGIVKLQGQVPSDDTRKLAEIIIGLEPGVRGVQNKLVLDSDGD
ncbi:MAG: BON domain-containing protein [Planctomycetota bacterium]|nr:BON domain-containing protein [Planctomycetota bacterium]